MLSVKNVEKSFPIISGNGPLLALHKLSFTMKAGEFTCLIGPSGSGKTTLINLIAGFLQPTRGTILLQGRSIQGPGPDRGVVFQEAALFPWFTALQNVAFGLANQGYKGRRAREKALSFLSLVGLKEYASAYPHQLSGGMKQRVALARVLALEPRLLLLDEPFGSLDSQTRQVLQEVILSLCLGEKTVLFITHDVEEAVVLADRILVFGPRPGQIVGDFQIDIPRPRREYPGAVETWESRLRSYLGCNNGDQKYLERGVML